MTCPACSSTKNENFGSYVNVRVCRACGAVHGRCYLGQSYSIVLPYWDDSVGETEEVYFDLDCLGSKGMTRRHGWYNPVTKRITQTG